MHQVEHVSQGDKSAAVATVVTAVDQARSRGLSEAIVSEEQVDLTCLLPLVHLLPKLSLQLFHLLFILFVYLHLLLFFTYLFT